MKKTILFGLSLFFALAMNAQTEILNIDGTLVNPVGIAVQDSRLFIGQVGNQTLSEIDLSQPDPKPITNLDEDISLIGDMIVDGNTLYISSSDDNGSIYQIDLTDTNNTVTQLISNLGGMTFGLAIQNNDLYATIRLSNKIVKIDLSQSTPTASDFLINIPGFAINDLAIYQNYLYIAIGDSNGGDRIARVNLADSNPTEELVINNIP